MQNTIQRKLTPEDRVNLEARLRLLSSDLNNTTEGKGEESIFSMPDILRNKVHYNSEMKRIANRLDFDNSLSAINKRERAKLSKRKTEIEIVIKANFPSWQEQWRTLKTSGPVDFNRSIEHTILFVQKFNKLVEEWKQIMNRLEPEDPTADNVYHLCAGIPNGRIT